MTTEYIGQLEGEVAMKSQESSNLRGENVALMQENERYRGLIETLLRHPAFTPFINDISKDPSWLQQIQPQPQPQRQQQQQQSVTPTQQPSQPQSSVTPTAPDSKLDFMNFDASQLRIPQQQPQQPQQQQQQQQQGERVGLAMIPENDFSKLNINGFNSMNFNNYSVNAFVVNDVPKGPGPVDLLIESPVRSAKLCLCPCSIYCCYLCS